MKPPLLPSERLRRVLRVARFDGASVLGLAGAFALVSAAFRDVTGAVIGLLVAAAGAIELHGASLLRSCDLKGVRWLLGSQLYLLAVILAYCAFRLARPDIASWRAVMTDDIAEPIRQAGMTVDQFLNLGPIKDLLVEYHQKFYDADVAAVFESAQNYVEKSAGEAKR